jgi:hypothetical protein
MKESFSFLLSLLLLIPNVGLSSSLTRDLQPEKMRSVPLTENMPRQGATTRCNDGSFSTVTGKEACAHHGAVMVRLNPKAQASVLKRANKQHTASDDRRNSPAQ